VLAAIAAVLVPDRSMERPKTQVEHPPIVGKDVSTPVAAIRQFGEEVFAAFAPLDVDPSVELTAYKVASVQRD
jgi:hypothetical protein